MLDAIAKLAQFMGEQISTEISRVFSEPNVDQAFSEIQEEATAQPSVLNKAKKLIGKQPMPKKYKQDFIRILL